MQLDGPSTAPIRKRGRPVNADSAETRSRILRAARLVINQRGYQSATFQAIAVEADLSRPSLHHYFDSREQIYETLIAEATCVMAECITQAQKHPTAVAQLCALVAAINEADQRDRSQIAFLVGARLDSLRNPHLQLPNAIGLREFMTTLVLEAALRGELPADTAVAPVVELLLALMWGMGFYAGFIDAAADMASISKQFERVFSHGLLGGAVSPDSAYDTSGDTPGTVVAQP